MSGSLAIRKLLYADSTEADVSRRGYHFSGAYEPLLYTVRLSQPAAVLPRSGLGLASACLAGCFLGCLTMKTRNKEKWWIGLLLMCGMYYNAVKSHKVHNGLAGHQCGFFASAMGFAGCGCRLVVHSGSKRVNHCLLCLFGALMWYELGRFHLWSEHVTEFRREVTPERTYNLLTEYVPQNLEVEFLPYRALTHT